MNADLKRTAATQEDNKVLLVVSPLYLADVSPAFGFFRSAFIRVNPRPVLTEAIQPAIL